MRKRLYPCGGWLLVLLVLGIVEPHSASAQSSTAPSVADTSSPRATLRSFINAGNEVYRIVKNGNYVDKDFLRFGSPGGRAIDCIDTRELPAFAAEQRASEVAASIKEILDREELPPWDEIPDDAAIEAAGGFEKLSRWRIPGTRLTIARIEEGPQKHEYLFSAGTVSRAVEYYRSVESRPYRTGLPETSPGLYQWYIAAPRDPVIAQIVKRLPERLRLGQTMGLTNWKWPGIIISVVVSVFVFFASLRLHILMSNRWQTKNLLLYWLTLIFPLLAIAAPMALNRIAVRYITLRGNPLYYLSFICTAIATFAAMIAVVALGNRLAETVIASPRINPKGLNAQLIRIASKLMSVVLASCVFLIGGQFLGIPVATLLASAGIGGIALALGAQDTLRTLFGTIMLMADKPFRVGERIVFKGYDGVVEDIGLRSTRIRLLNSHQVSVPNDQLASCDIENVGRRKYIRRAIDIQVPNDTPHEKLEAAIKVIREQLDEHEGMHQDYPPRVYFTDFLPAAFSIKVMYWYHPPDYWQYLAFSERVNLAISQAFETHGIQFSLPQRITHTSHANEQTPIDIRMVNPEA